jgi:hypothetical protein
VRITTIKGHPASLDRHAPRAEISGLPAAGGYRVDIADPRDVWNHVQFGDALTVGRRDDDGFVYISLESDCDWKPEHGLQMVFVNGRRVNKVGPYDGHFTNADAYGDANSLGVRGFCQA